MKVSISLPDELVAYLDQRVENRSQLIESLLKQWRKNQEEQAMAEACILLDEMNLGWDEECEQAAIIDWEASGW
jgi:antitoxin ParD1/3/4